MLDWLWQGVALIAGIAAVWLGVAKARGERDAAIDRAARAEAERLANETAMEQLRKTRERFARQPPADPKKRTDFEGQG